MPVATYDLPVGGLSNIGISNYDPAEEVIQEMVEECQRSLANNANNNS
jgi:hypothetical protein